MNEIKRKYKISVVELPPHMTNPMSGKTLTFRSKYAWLPTELFEKLKAEKSNDRP